jgi:hypothetical protein
VSVAGDEALAGAIGGELFASDDGGARGGGWASDSTRSEPCELIERETAHGSARRNQGAGAARGAAGRDARHDHGRHGRRRPEDRDPEPDRATDEQSIRRTIHAFVNRNKRSMTLNMKSPEGQAIFRKLAAGADVIVEASGPASWTGSARATRR